MNDRGQAERPMAARIEMTESRPALVTWSYRLWYASGVLYAVFAILLLALTASTRPAVAIPVGLVLLAVGVVLILLARRVTPADPRWRSALAVLTLVVTVLSMVGAIGGIGPLFVVAGVVGLIGSVCAYRPAADEWFNPRGHEAQA